MTEKVSYTNKDNQLRLDVQVTTRLTYIFGGNGTGKTTFSRVFDKEDCAVFNEDFINENVYITGRDGAKPDSTNKENFSNIFLGKEAVQIAKYVQEQKVVLKEIKTEISTKLNDLNILLQEKKLPSVEKLENLKQNVKVSFEFDDKKTKEENYSNFKIIQFLNTNISNDEEFEKSLLIYHEKTLTNDLATKISNDSRLSAIIKKQKVEIDSELVDAYIANLRDIEASDDIFGKNNKTEVKKWISEGLNLHSNVDDCIFCDNKNIQEQKKKWKDALQDQHQQIKSKLILEINALIDSLSVITNNKELYSKVASNLCETIQNAENKLSMLVELINKSQAFQYIPVEISVDNIFKSSVDLVEDLKNYVINKVISETLYSSYYSESLDMHIGKKQKESVLKNNNYAEHAKNKIVEYCTVLGFNKEIQVLTDVRSAQPKISLSADKKTNKFSHYSDGQKHKIALAVFLAMIDLSEVEYEYVILDDPVISLDVHAYHAFKDIMMNHLPNFSSVTENTKIILLTHNINFLYVMVSNLIGNEVMENLCRVLEITPTSVNLIPVQILNFDDISLFKYALDEIVDLNDLSLKYWMCMKIFRNFLDLKLRIIGEPSTLNPSEEINKLGLEISNAKKLQNISNNLSRICRKKNVKVEDIKSMYIDLNDSMDILGFPRIITDKNMKELDKFSNDEITDEFPTSSDFLRGILLFARNIHFSTNSGVEEQIKNYVSHPRHQITESLIAIKEKIDY